MLVDVVCVEGDGAEAEFALVAVGENVDGGNVIAPVHIVGQLLQAVFGGVNQQNFGAGLEAG